MKTNYYFYILILLFLNCNDKNEKTDAISKEKFLKEQKKFGTPIFKYLKTKFYTLHFLDQDEFTKKIDSLKNIYTNHLHKNKKNLDSKTYNYESLAIRVSFDKYILEYPKYHKRFTGKNIRFSKVNQKKLNTNILDFNQPQFLSNKYFISYATSFISIESSKKLRNGDYNKMDNQQLHANWNVINTFFSNLEVNTYWKEKYLYEHIDNKGVKNSGDFYNNLTTNNNNNNALTKLINRYKEQYNERENHIIEIYKTVDNFKLEMHLFLPDKNVFKGIRPTIVQFHGGSWSSGNPFWYFSTAKEYAKNGWVVAVVDYRIKAKQGTYPFEAVKDAKSAIRWLREHAKKYTINPNKIIATGNSAGGHLALATTLVENWNEKTDNLKTSAKPNFLIVNSGAYDLTGKNTKWIREHIDYKDRAKEISPNHLTKKTNTKMLLIHGEKDMNCPYANANVFYTKMKSLGNDIQFYTVKDAEHYIWFGKYSLEVSKVTSAYIQQQKIYPSK